MNENIYKIIFQKTADAIFLHDLKGKIIDVNQEACKRLGYSRKKLLTMTPLDFDSQEDASKFPQVIHKLVKDGVIVKEIVHISKNKRRIPTEINSRVIEINNQKLVLTIARDITERKKLEIVNDAAIKNMIFSKEELLKNDALLENKNIALKEVIGNIEIERNNLRNIIKINIDDFILPELRKVTALVDDKNKIRLRKLEEEFRNIMNSFGVNLIGLGLTHRQIEVCRLIKSGLDSRRIAEKLDISCKSVNTHRRNIRKKLQLNKKKVNLATFLNQIIK